MEKGAMGLSLDGAAGAARVHRAGMENGENLAAGEGGLFSVGRGRRPGLSKPKTRVVPVLW